MGLKGDYALYTDLCSGVALDRRDRECQND
jgi:hypothetical protein